MVQFETRETDCFWNAQNQTVIAIVLSSIALRWFSINFVK